MSSLDKKNMYMYGYLSALFNGLHKSWNFIIDIYVSLYNNVLYKNAALNINNSWCRLLIEVDQQGAIYVKGLQAAIRKIEYQVADQAARN